MSLERRSRSASTPLCASIHATNNGNEEATMAVVTTLDIAGLTAEEYSRILDRIGVEKRPAGGLYQHIAHATDNGYRIIEIWDGKAGLELFLKDTLFPAAQALKIQREMTIMTQTLHNIFVPRIGELSALSDDAPGGPIKRAKP